MCPHWSPRLAHGAPSWTRRVPFADGRLVRPPREGSGERSANARCISPWPQADTRHPHAKANAEDSPSVALRVVATMTRGTPDPAPEMRRRGNCDVAGDRALATLHKIPPAVSRSTDAGFPCNYSKSRRFNANEDLRGTGKFPPPFLPPFFSPPTRSSSPSVEGVASQALPLACFATRRCSPAVR